MQVLNQQAVTPAFRFPFEELEKIESIITTSKQWIEALELRRSMLTSELDRITRPTHQLVTVLPAKPSGMGIMYRGEWYARKKYIDIHECLLRKLWIDFPDKRQNMAKAMRRFGASRSYVATSTAELFTFRSGSWARKFSRSLVDEWYFDTNLSPERMRKILPAAVEAAGLKLGDDVKICWR